MKKPGRGGPGIDEDMVVTVGTKTPKYKHIRRRALRLAEETLLCWATACSSAGHQDEAWAAVCAEEAEIFNILAAAVGLERRRLRS